METAKIKKVSDLEVAVSELRNQKISLENANKALIEQIKGLLDENTNLKAKIKGMESDPKMPVKNLSVSDGMFKLIQPGVKAFARGPLSSGVVVCIDPKMHGFPVRMPNIRITDLIE